LANLSFSVSTWVSLLFFARYSLLDVPVQGPGSDAANTKHAIHTIVAQKGAGTPVLVAAAPGAAASCPIVLWHGFGQGAASWWRNLPGLARGHDGPVRTLFSLEISRWAWRLSQRLEDPQRCGPRQRFFLLSFGWR
jgi:hypothetical protein